MWKSWYKCKPDINTRLHAPLDLLWQFVEFSVCKIKCTVALSNESLISASVLQSIPPFLSTFSVCAFSSLCETEVVLFEHKHSCGLWLMLCWGIWCLNAPFCFVVFLSLFTLPRGYACLLLELIFISSFYIERPNILRLN